MGLLQQLLGRQRRNDTAPEPELQVGGLYSVNSGDGKYGVVKVLALDPSAVHLRLYKNKFNTRPEAVDSSTLSLGSMNDDDEEGFGIGHFPLSRRDFTKWQPVLLSQETVSEEELEGYNMWKEAGGGVFGTP